jgi:hypothetical protein
MSGALGSLGEVAMRLALALALTIAVEVPVAALLGLRSRRAVAAVALVSVVTNPPLNLALFALALTASAFAENPAAYWPTVALLETLAVLAEWRLLLWVLGGESRRMLGVSVAMNVVSFGTGLALSFAVPGWVLG